MGSAAAARGKRRLVYNFQTKELEMRLGKPRLLHRGRAERQRQSAFDRYEEVDAIPELPGVGQPELSM